MSDLNKKLEEVGLKIPHILLPRKGTDLTKFSCIAADQFTQDLSYWNKVKEYVGDNISTYNLIYPEAEMEYELNINKEKFDEAIEKKIKEINGNMNDYLSSDAFYDVGECFTYVERQVGNEIRRGLVVAIDLEEYDYNIGAKSLMRATERTVVERLKVRKKIRKNATIDLPHIMVLINDKEDKLFSAVSENIDSEMKLYDFNLMFDSGNIKGYKILDKTLIEKIADILLELKLNANDGFLYAVGDGNHSLAAAKDVYEETGRGRYALIELVNIYDRGLKFYPIHRLVMGITEEEFKKTTGIDPYNPPPLQDLQIILDKYNYKIDYIHGKEECINIAKENNCVAIVYDTFSADTLFDDVIKHGALCRKSFSMGRAIDKRFYLEAQKIY
ncbi:MAG: DUF1015 family protein [Lachnospiraceae bacterium]|nr:DUF1015 family protein [Lachnospiraceae bacterium]